MALHFNDADFRRDAIGMPASHANSFKAISKMENVVILSRAPGPTCRQLLEHGYDTKGFRVHAKSCDWGPMAGFVMRDPRLNKKGLANEAFNRKEHKEALEDSNHAGWKASTTPLKIYPERLLWLQQKGLIQLEPVRGNTHFFNGVATHRTGVHFNYIVVAEQEQGQNVWGIYLNTSGGGFVQEVGSTPRSYYMPSVFGTRYEAMLAMTNPMGHASWPVNDFRNAITGDYDLFSVWPTREKYDAKGMDHRVLGTAQARTDIKAIDHMEHHFTTVDGHAQATKLGNLTDRLYLICQLLNSAIGGEQSASVPPGPFPKRMVCWHSDETARPGVGDVDLPLIAFFPWGGEVGLEDITDFHAVVRYCMLGGFAVQLAEGWLLAPDASNPNRLGPEGYGGTIETWERQSDGTPNPLQIPSWYNG